MNRMVFPVLVWSAVTGVGLYVASQLQARGLEAGTAENLELLIALLGAIAALKLMRRREGRGGDESSGKLRVA